MFYRLFLRLSTTTQLKKNRKEFFSKELTGGFYSIASLELWIQQGDNIHRSSPSFLSNKPLDKILAVYYSQIQINRDESIRQIEMNESVLLFLRYVMKSVVQHVCEHDMENVVSTRYSHMCVYLCHIDCEDFRFNLAVACQCL